MGAGALAERRFRSRDLFGALLDLLLVLLELLRDIVCGFASGLDWALVACGRLVFALLFGLLGSSLSLGRERLSYPCDRGPTSPLTSVRSGVGAPARTAAFPLLTNTQWTITARPANVGLNPDFEHRTRGLRVFIDMTKDTNVEPGATLSLSAGQISVTKSTAERVSARRPIARTASRTSGFDRSR